MRRFSSLSLIAIVFALSSCSSAAKTLSKVKIERDIDLSNQQEQALATDDFRRGYWPDENWWEMFEDEQLSTFIQTGIDSNPSLKAAESRVKQANQEAFVTRSKLMPQIGGFFNYLYTYLSEKGLKSALRGIDKNINLFALLFDFTYEFDFWKKNRNAYEAALGQMQTQEAIRHQTQMILSVSIAKQYYTLQSNMAKMALLQEILEKKAKLFRLVELRRANRIANMIDVNGIKQEIISLQEAIAGLAGELKLERSLLFTLMGQNPGEDKNIMACWDVPEHPFELPDDIGIGLLARRPDLMSQVWSVYSASKNIGVAVAEFLPDFNLIGFGGTDAVRFQDLFSNKSGTATALPLIAQPIFTGGKLRAGLKAKLAAYESAVFSYNDSLLQAANEVVAGIININTAKEKYQYQIEEVCSKKDTYDLIHTRYKHGIDSMMSVLNSDDQYLKSRFNEIELSNDRVQATIDLVRALGGGYHSKQAEEKEIKKL